MDVDVIDLSSDDSNDSDKDEVPSSTCIARVCSEKDEYTGDNDINDVRNELTRDISSTQRKGRKKNGNIARSKKTTAAERQALKKKLAEEKKAIKNANKIYKPGECMKYITIEMHPVLTEAWYCADVQREVNICGAKVKPSTAVCDPKLVLWSRTLPPKLTCSSGVVQLTPTKQSCSHGLYIQTVEDIESLVASQQLSQHMEQTKQLAGCDLTLLVFGVKDYFKASGRKTTNRRNKLMTEIDLEKAITDLLVTTNCDTIIANTPNDLALTIAQFTKAIAEEPYKKAKRAFDEQAVFYMRGDNKKCVSVDKDGNGLSRLWQQMIAVLPLSSLETSRALCAEYSTPLALYEALKTDKVSEIADIGVSRAGAPNAKARRIGPEFARKLHTLFTEEDGNVLID